MTEFKRLAVHNSACNDLYFVFQECENAVRAIEYLTNLSKGILNLTSSVSAPLRQNIWYLLSVPKRFSRLHKGSETYTTGREFAKVEGETGAFEESVGRKEETRGAMMIDSVEAVGESSKKLDSPTNGSSFNAKTDVENFSIEEEELQFPPDDDILDMVKDVHLEKPLATVTERYFTTYYRMNFPKEGEDICIRIHTNRLCMISLAPSHAIFDGERKIEKIDFQVTDKLNRADNEVSGKAKHGAQPLHETSKICSITCSDGKSWIVRCGMNGKLTEANTDLLVNPELLREPPHKGGYLAIVLPKLDAPEKMKQYLMTQEAYDAALKERLHEKIKNGVGCINGAVKRSCDDESLISEYKEKIMKTEAIESDRKIIDEIIVSSTLSCI